VRLVYGVHMGKVIKRSAATAEIMRDVETTLSRARSMGGVWQTHAEARLLPVLVVGEQLATELDAARTELAPQLEARRAADRAAELEIALVMDQIWTAIGRPAYDPTLSIVFPGGVAHYTETGTDELPLRMNLIAGLLDRGVVTKLAGDDARAFAARIRGVTAPLRRAIDALALPQTRVEQIKREQAALADVAHLELVHLKRLYFTEGFSEADIHQVIPSHQRKKTIPPPAR
jgi:hypothetical protein